MSRGTLTILIIVMLGLVGLSILFVKAVARHPSNGRFKFYYFLPWP